MWPVVAAVVLGSALSWKAPADKSFGVLIAGELPNVSVPGPGLELLPWPDTQTLETRNVFLLV